MVPSGGHEGPNEQHQRPLKAMKVCRFFQSDVAPHDQSPNSHDERLRRVQNAATGFREQINGK